METNRTPSEWIALIEQSNNLSLIEKQVLTQRFTVTDDGAHRVENVARRFEVTRETVRNMERRAMSALNEEFAT